MINYRCFFTLVLFCLVSMLPAQENDGALFTHRFAWPHDAYALWYEVLIEQEEDGVFSNILQEFTEESSFSASLPPGNFRLRVIPYDFRGLPAEASPWRYFRVLVRVVEDEEDPQAEAEPQLVLEDVPPPVEEPGLVLEDVPPQIVEPPALAAAQDVPAAVLTTRRFNTVGISAVSLGSNSFIPSGGVVRGTFSPANNFFLEGGVEVSFWGAAREIEDGDNIRHSYRETSAIHPFVNAGVFLPFAGRGGWYASAGFGLRFAGYYLREAGEIQGRDDNMTLFAMNITTGFNLWNWFDISYTLRTDFTSINSSISVGYVHRFMPRN